MHWKKYDGRGRYISISKLPVRRLICPYHPKPWAPFWRNLAICFFHSPSSFRLVVLSTLMLDANSTLFLYHYNMTVSQLTGHLQHKYVTTFAGIKDNKYSRFLVCSTFRMQSNTSEVVAKILQNAQTDCSFKSTQVTKDIDVDIDVGNLLAVDQNPLDLNKFRYSWAIIQCSRRFVVRISTVVQEVHPLRFECTF